MNAITIQTIEDFADVLLAECGGDVDRAALSAAEDQVQTLRLWRRFMLERAGQSRCAEEANVRLPVPLQTDPDRPGHSTDALDARRRVPAPVRMPNPSRVNPASLAAMARHSSLLDTFKFSTGEALAQMSIGQLQRLAKASARDAEISAAILKKVPQCSGSMLVVEAVKPAVLKRILEKFHA